MLSARLAQALVKGRRPAPPATHSTLLETLLRKRAMAHLVGDRTLEAMLRNQIRWSLPVQGGEPSSPLT